MFKVAGYRWRFDDDGASEWNVQKHRKGMVAGGMDNKGPPRWPDVIVERLVSLDDVIAELEAEGQHVLARTLKERVVE